MTFHTLFVCTGNVCRSPAAERVFAAAVDTTRVGVSSAGTRAIVGAPMTEPMARLVAGHGADALGFAASQLTADLIRRADLVVAVTDAHRSAVVAVHPAAVQRSFVLGELSHMLAGVDSDELPGSGHDDRLRVMVELAKRRRTPGIDPAEDVADPFGRSTAEYARSFGQIVQHLEPLLRLVTGSR